MNGQAQLLRAILEDPSDPMARLVFADWCDEHGDSEWAEFIRYGVNLYPGAYLVYDNAAETARSTRYTTQPTAVASRTLVKRGAEWMGDPWRSIFLDLGGWAWQGGFLTAVTMTCSQFMRHAKALFERHPITEVTLSDKKQILTPVSDPRMPGMDSKWVWFYRADWSEPHGYAFLPRELSKTGAAETTRFDTEEAAINSQVIRAVSYGRRLADLPSLWPTPSSSLPSPS